MVQLANYWYFGQDATVSVSSSRTSLSFGLSRFVSKEDSAASAVFKNIIQGNAHLNMEDPPITNNCKDDEHYGPCGNRRGSLTECRCKELDRLTQPSIRRNYENHVIQTVLKMIGKGTGPFNFKLASFCSGTLLGEEILLFRLLNELKKKQMKGIIEVFFIDTWYQPLIANSYPSNFTNAIEKQEQGYLKQFLTEMRQSLPEDIRLQVTFFSDSADYIQKAKDDARFKHHLLICADPGDKTQASMQRLRNEAGLHMADPILLIKTQDKGPQVCELNPSGRPVNCHDPKDDDNSTLKTLGIVSGIAIFVSLLAYAIFKPSNKRATT